MVKNLYAEDGLSEILNRIEKLSADADRQWGTMEVAQMLEVLLFLMIGILKPRSAS